MDQKGSHLRAEHGAAVPGAQRAAVGLLHLVHEACMLEMIMLI